MGERSAMFQRNLRGGPGSTNKYTKFGQLIIRKVIKIIATRCHILRLKVLNSLIRFLVSARLSVQMRFDTIWILEPTAENSYWRRCRRDVAP